MATGTRMALIVEYDGTGYHGSQLQASAPTIQEVIEEALCKLSGERIRVKMASRTDSGVHAKGQVVSFRTGSSLPAETFVRGLNYYLPEDVAVKEAYKVDDSFDVRRNAISREYKYYILNGPTRSPMRRSFAYLVPGKLDTEAMNQACQNLTGKQDFASFATRSEIGEKSTVRNIFKAETEKKGDLIILDMTANSFLPHQVRNTVGSLIRVGQGKMTVEEFTDMVQAGKPGLAGPTAPAHGLCLIRVNYAVPFGEK